MSEDKRVPTHYKSEYLHWDLAIKVPLTYLEGNTTKYVSRWRKKGGGQDLQKAMHYLDKMIETNDIRSWRRYLAPHQIEDEVLMFAEANSLMQSEREYIMAICLSSTTEDLRRARVLLEIIIDNAIIRNPQNVEINQPGTPEDGGQHANE